MRAKIDALVSPYAYPCVYGFFDREPEYYPDGSVIPWIGKYRFLSNFHLVSISYEGRTYTSTEAAYASAKTLNPSDKDLLTECTPAQAKSFGRHVVLRPDWEDVKLQVMYEINKIKYQDPSLRARLAATGDLKLIEANWWGDTFWGECRGKGHNHLGQILMRIRAEVEYVQGLLKPKEHYPR